MLGISSSTYETGLGKGDIEQASGVQPYIWYPFDRVYKDGAFPPSLTEFPSTASGGNFSSVGSAVLPINSNTGTPKTIIGSMHRQAISFDGTDDVIKQATVITSTNKAGTMLLVFKKSDGTNDIVVSEDDTQASGSFYVKLTGTDNANVVINMGESHNVAKTLPLTNNFTAGQDAMLLIRRNTSGHVFIYSQNGLEISNTGNTDILAMPNFVFKHIGGAATIDFAGSIGEFAFWDQELSDAACLKVIDSIKEKWNLSPL